MKKKCIGIIQMKFWHAFFIDYYYAGGCFECSGFMSLVKTLTISITFKCIAFDCVLSTSYLVFEYSIDIHYIAKNPRDC